ncbi:venom carboxylesterase-6-like [Anoplophora glabripennis]|uniref:venom carboxylesterase-6-like n=1 Tax=Anoplophora glabripennis TaxID=217634 RepID=UPI0008746D4A|nr:venom carboxylesterase-6-like [Anoplophora glabripennis]
MILITFCSLFLIISGSSAIPLAEEPIVTLPYGQIRGRIAVTESDGVTFYSFQEVPFAAPPVGNLRFQPPQPVPSWEGILDTQTNTKMCYQVTANYHYENEDCLYLNVYSPVPPGSESTLPVLVNIYGGTFTHGSAMYQYAGPQSFMSRGVVLVTFNYRVGPFGFLSTEDTVIPGNMGVKDQQYALKWVQENIHLFGGDPTKVTLMGQSAGASSVTYQILSPGSAGLFRAAIAESGSALCPWSHQRHALDSAYKVAAYIDSSFDTTSSTQQLADFLISADASAIDAASEKYQVWAPVVEPEHDGAFITDSMYELVKNGQINKVPLIIGMNSEEYIAKAADLDSFKVSMAATDKYPQKIISENMNIVDDQTKIEAGEAVRKIYTSGLFQDDLASAIRYLSDNTFNKGVIRYAEFQSQYTDVYFYQFSYHGLLGRNNVSMEGLEGRVQHGEDSRYLWTAALDISSYPESDRKTANRYMTLFTDFAKYLNPTPEKKELFDNLQWPTVSSDNFYYLDIDENLEIKVNPRESSYQKWIQVYEQYGVQPFYTF